MLGSIACIMPGNMTKAKAFEWLEKHGGAVRGYPQEAAAAYLGLGVKRFRDGVAAGSLPQPQRHGKRLIWDKIALDKHMDAQFTDNGVSSPDHDPIMADIHAAHAPPIRSANQS
jgi:hypothetical protein